MSVFDAILVVAVDVRYPPGVLHVVAHPVHLHLQPLQNMLSWRRKITQTGRQLLEFWKALELEQFQDVPFCIIIYGAQSEILWQQQILLLILLLDRLWLNVHKILRMFILLT